MLVKAGKGNLVGVNNFEVLPFILGDPMGSHIQNLHANMQPICCDILPWFLFVLDFLNKV